MFCSRGVQRELVCPLDQILFAFFKRDILMVIGSAPRLFTSPSPSGSPPNYIPNLRRIWTLLLLALLPSLINAATPGTLQTDFDILHSIAASNSTFNTSWNGSTFWIEFASWNGTNPCLWYAVTCNNSRVTRLSFEYFATGPIPKEIANLSALERLTIHGNRDGVSGPIPKELGSLSLLTHLDLSENYNITGPIPKELGSLSSLKYLDLSKNYNIIGSIPKELGSLSSLKHLDLSHNSLTGPIPASICKLPSLIYLDLSENNLTGPLPEAIIQLYERSQASVKEDDGRNIMSRGFLNLGDSFTFLDSDRKIICPRTSYSGRPVFWISDECYYRLCMPPHGKRTVLILWSVWGAIAAVVATSVMLVSERCRPDEEKSNGGKSNVKGSSDDGDAAIGTIGVCKYLWGVLSLGFILVDVVTNFQTMNALMGGWSVYVVAFLIVSQHIISASILHRNCTSALLRTDVKLVWDWRRCIIGYQGERSEFGREGKGIDKPPLSSLQALLSWTLGLVYVILFDILSLFSLKLGFQLKLPSGWLDLRTYWTSRELTDALFQALPQAIFLSVIVAIQATPMYSKMMLDTTQVVLSISSSLGSVICVLAMLLWEARMGRENALRKLWHDFVGISPVVVLVSEDEVEDKADCEGGGKRPLASLATIKTAEDGKEI